MGARFPEMAKIRKKLPSSDIIFFKRVWCPRVSKIGKMKMFHSYQKEQIHKISYSGAKAKIKSKISKINKKNMT